MEKRKQRGAEKDGVSEGEERRKRRGMKIKHRKGIKRGRRKRRKRRDVNWEDWEESKGKGVRWGKEKITRKKEAGGN